MNDIEMPGMGELQEKKRHGDFAFPMRVYLNDFASFIEESIPWHWHEELEFAIVTQGRVEISAGTEAFILEQGNGMFINANTLHCMKPVGEERAYMLSVVAHSSILGFEKGFLLSAKYVNPFIKGEVMKYQLMESRVEWQKQCILLLQGTYEIYTAKEYAFEYQLHNLLCQVWFIFLKNCFLEQPEEIKYGDEDESRIYLAMEYMHNHFREQITLDDICDEIHISKSECCRCFKRNLKMTPFEYLLRYRITNAAKMLGETNIPITEVALNSGFNSTSYFGKVFRSYMNCSPKEYKKSKNLK